MMVKLKLKAVIVGLATFLAVSLYGQEYKVKMSTGKVLIREVGKVTVEGYSGNEVIFKTEGGNYSRPKRAEGLKSLSSAGLEDNSGIGLSIEKGSNTIEVRQVSRNSNIRYKIMLPKGVAVSYQHSTHWGSTLYLKSIDSEIEVSTNHSNVDIKDVTGPMTVSSVHGKVDVIFSKVSQKAPVSIASVHGHIDVSIPNDTKADLKLSTGWGEIFTNLDIAVKTEQKTGSGDGAHEHSHSSTKIQGKINNGGVSMNFKSTHSNIYLRKK